MIADSRSRIRASSAGTRLQWPLRVLVATIAWSIFAVGGVYAWAAVPIIVLGVTLAALTRPQIGRSMETRLLDRTLLAAIGLATLQLLPLPQAARVLVSPQHHFARAELLVGPGSEWQSLSLDPWSSAYAVALLATAVLVFWSSRYLCGSGHAYRIVTAIAIIGLLAGLTAIVQQAGDHTKIYGYWQPIDEGARPFGPFVNRNHFATWVVMAIPLAAGYVVASFFDRRGLPFVPDEIATFIRSLGSRAAWVAVSAAVMSLALVASTSRSGLIAFMISLAVGMAMGRRRFDRRTAIWLTVWFFALLIFLGTYGRVEPLLSRAEETLVVGTGGRSEIWHDTIAMIQDFWLTGTGVGAYQTAMLIYQRTNRLMFTNQAHNQYLQMMAEGGLLVVVPAALAIVAFVRLFFIRLRRDTSQSIWLRVGGATALIAVAVQSFWETGLRMPANGILFAVAAAIAVHRPSTGRQRSTTDA